MSDEVETLEIFPRYNKKIDLSLIVEFEGIERRYYLSVGDGHMICLDRETFLEMQEVFSGVKK